jgi:enoyl-CoA hydratase/carnithine racemase
VLTIAMRGGQIETLSAKDSREISRAIDAANKDTAVNAILLLFDGGLIADDAAGEVFRPDPLLLAIGGARKPLVAAVNGRVGGATMAMLLYCDLVYVAEDAALSCPATGLAASLQTPWSQLLAARIGHVRAFELLALEMVIDGRTAAEWGIANAAIPATAVVGHAQVVARRLAARPAGALASFPLSRLSTAEALRDMRTRH